MISRREFIQTAAILTAGMLIGCSESSDSEEGLQIEGQMPDESEPHKRTWMAFGASEAIWGKKLLPVVRQNLAIIAQTIVKYEPVSMLVRASEYALARELVGTSVELIVSPLDDFWVRDTGPVFVKDQQGQKAGINFNFNGWGERQAFSQDAKVAAFIAQQAGVRKYNQQSDFRGWRY